ncbi:MAG: hypothetical protein GY851_34780 [bacterium]|nr:hypothetical protein [bacterium]
MPFMVDAVRNGLSDNEMWVPLFCCGIGFGLQGIILLQFFIYESFLTETVEIRHDTVHITRRIMGIPRRRNVPLDETTALYIPHFSSLFYGYFTGYRGAVEARWHRGRRRFGANLNLQEARWVVQWLTERSSARNNSE